MKKITTTTLTIIVFISLIGIFTITNLLHPKTDFSDNENRSLTPFPTVSLANITSGNFDDQFESWFSDHFIGRDFWITSKARMRKAMGAIENNGVYFGKDGILANALTTYDPKTLDNNISYINEFADENHIQANVMIVPGTIYGEQEDLPFGAYNIDTDTTISYIYENLNTQNTIDVRNALTTAHDEYFKTDHHWNETGAYIGYEAICEQVLHTEPQTFSYRKVSDSFVGSMYSKSGAFWSNGDDLYMMYNKNTEGSYVSFEDGSTSASMFIHDNLDKKDQYTYYLDGNHACISIQTNNYNGKKAVIVKDSFANILIPYLAAEYSELTVIDLRYYHSSVSDYIDEDTDFYVIYSLETICTDPSLSALW